MKTNCIQFLLFQKIFVNDIFTVLSSMIEQTNKISLIAARFMVHKKKTHKINPNNSHMPTICDMCLALAH